MLNPIHTRDTSLAQWPFESMDDVDEFVVSAAEIVRDAVDAEPDVSVSATYPDRFFPMMGYEEFCSAKAALPFEDVSMLTIRIKGQEDPEFSVNVVLTDRPLTASVAVRGVSVTRVDGVNVQVRKVLDKALSKVEASHEMEAQRRNEKRAEYVERLTPSGPFGLPIGTAAGALIRARRRKRKLRDSDALARAKPSMWRRFVDHPWAVEIVGGTIASAVAVGVVAAIVMVFH